MMENIKERPMRVLEVGPHIPALKTVHQKSWRAGAEAGGAAWMGSGGPRALELPPGQSSL